MGPLDSWEFTDSEGRAYAVTVEPDLDSTPRDADCYSPDDVRRWELDEWRYVGLVVTPIINDEKIDTCAESLWGVGWDELPKGQWIDRTHQYIVDSVTELAATARRNAQQWLREARQG